MTDFTAMAREITGPCTCTVDYTRRGREDPTCAWHNYAPEIVDALTLSHAAGRAEGLADDESYITEARDFLRIPEKPGHPPGLRVDELAAFLKARDSRIALPPITPEQNEYLSGLQQPKPDLDTMIPAPAPVDPGLAAQEVERRCLHPGSCGRHGMCMYPTFPAMTPCADDPAALSAPRPAQTKGPTE